MSPSVKPFKKSSIFVWKFMRKGEMAQVPMVPLGQLFIVVQSNTAGDLPSAAKMI
jgi:hypothetical protein